MMTRPGLLLSSLALSLLGPLWAAPANATAQLGGVLSLGISPGGCSLSRQVPLTTRQDQFTLAASTGCHGASVQMQLRGDAAAPSIGLSATTTGTGLNSQANAFVGLLDEWTIGVAPGVAVGASFKLPVSFRLEGDVSAGALYADAFGRFMDFHMGLGQFGTASGVFQVNGRVDTTGHFDQTFAGEVTMTNYGPTVPTLAQFEAQLFVPGLNLGTVDFYNTFSAAVELPPGFTATSSSGQVLFAAAPVPEPATSGLWLAGLCAAAAWSRRQVKSSQGKSSRW